MEKTYKELKEELKELKKAKLFEAISTLPTADQIGLELEECRYSYSDFISEEAPTAREVCEENENFFTPRELAALFSYRNEVKSCRKVKYRHYIECDQNGNIISDRIHTQKITYQAYFKG